MAVKTTVNCAELDQKLDALYAYFKLRPDLTPRASGPSELADATGAGRSTIGKWRMRNAETGRDAWQVSPEHVTALAKLLLPLLGSNATEEEAVRLWQAAPAAEFRRRLITRAAGSIDAVLRRKDPVLRVECGLVMPSLNMVDIDLAPVEGEFELHTTDRFTLRVHARAGCTLVVLGVGPDGWYLFAPAADFPGKVLATPASVPPSPSGWAITKTFGPHRFIMIELAAGSAPVRRERGEPLALRPDQETTLVEELLDVTRSGDWRWGEAHVFVHRPAIQSG